MSRKTKASVEEPEEEEQILGGGSTLVRGADTEESGDRQEARQRDSEPDDYDLGTDVSEDRVRGAGGQSLDELTMVLGRGGGLEEHSGGLRHDRPEPNVNDADPDDPMLDPL
jgi:hypothetical protein